MTKVLVVDDEPQILRALRINLQARAYEVVTAGSGRAALQQRGRPAGQRAGRSGRSATPARSGSRAPCRCWWWCGKRPATDRGYPLVQDVPTRPV